MKELMYDPFLNVNYGQDFLSQQQKTNHIGGYYKFVHPENPLF